MIPVLYTKKEVSKILKCSERTIDNFVILGKLNSTKIGRRRMFTEKHINDLIKAGESWEKIN